MKKVFPALVLLLFLLGCVPPKGEDTLPPVDMRAAVFTEIENTVQAREYPDAMLEDAKIGMTLFPGGSAQSGEDGRARLDLAPEGTIIRLAPNSIFFIQEMGTRNDSPYTRLKLLTGELWIILFGGKVETDTPYGTATVRGSMMSVRFDPEGEGMVVNCLEGHCALENEAGKVELTEGEFSIISEEHQPPASPIPMPKEEQETWQKESPEAASWMSGTPIAPTPLAIPQDALPESAVNEDGKPTGPLSYNLDNNCPDRTWTWTFEGPVTLSFTLGPGETATGTLPAGDYMVTDVLAEIGGSDRDQTGPGLIRGGDTISLKSCPGEQK